MTKYPDSIPTLDEIFKAEDLVDWMLAAKWEDLRQELRAALVELGTLPKGGYADVKARLNALGTGDMKYTDARFKLGSFTRDTEVASGTQEVSGVGFTPKLIVFFMCQPGTNEASFGVDNGTDKRGMYRREGGTTFGSVATYSILDDQSAGVGYQGYVSARNADGFTITWVRAGAPTGTITNIYIAFR